MNSKKYTKVIDSEKNRMVINSHDYDGVLIIGDPHMSSISVSTRVEKDFTLLTLGKLEWSLNHAKDNNLLPICMGDLFTIRNDNDVRFVGRVLSLLKKNPDMLCLVGNHDKGENDTYTEDDIMFIIESSGFIKLINKMGIVGEFSVGGKTLTIGASPYGFSIPDCVEAEHEVLWLTHHDLDFDPLFSDISCYEIDGVNTVINGHLHKTYDPIVKGETHWFNPGNIFRMSTAEKNHIPSVWSWFTDDIRNLTQHIIPHNKDVFYEEVDVPLSSEVTEEMKTAAQSVFVQALKSDLAIDSIKTNDGTLVRRLLDEAELELEPSNEVISIVNLMLEDVVPAKISG